MEDLKLITDCESIQYDLLAVARTLCGKSSGIVCILDVNAASYFYDGSIIKNSIPSLGYILGDEGSGAAIGKTFISNLLKNRYPKRLYENFMNYHNTSPQEIVEAIYRHEFPEHYLSQFTQFIAENIGETKIYNLVFKSFSDFISENIKQYDYLNYPVYFTGSIALLFEDILRDACLTNGIWPAEIT